MDGRLFSGELRHRPDYRFFQGGSMEEKRRLRRKYLLAGVKVRLPGAQEFVDAVMLNINRGGIGIYASGPLRKGAEVSVRITCVNGKKPVEAEEIPGVVRWVQPVGTKFGAGIMFSSRVNRKTFPILSICLEYARANR